MANDKQIIKNFLNVFFNSLQFKQREWYYALNKDNIRNFLNKYNKSSSSTYQKMVSLVQKYQDIFSHFGISVDYENEILYYNKIVVLLE
jgi:VanZ family protein